MINPTFPLATAAPGPGTLAIDRSDRSERRDAAVPPVVRHQPTVAFGFRFDPLFRAMLAPLGIHPDRARIEVGPDRLTARFGPWVVATSLTNISDVEVTGPYPRLKVAGGPRLSFVDHGLTFATNADRGVCIRFARPVVGIDPTGRMCHPGLTVTVADPHRLAGLLTGIADRLRAEGETAHAAVDATADITTLSSAELRTRARDLGLSGVGRLRKAELIELLSAPDFPLP
jgi:hypothetical protein